MAKTHFKPEFFQKIKRIKSLPLVVRQEEAQAYIAAVRISKQVIYKSHQEAWGAFRRALNIIDGFENLMLLRPSSSRYGYEEGGDYFLNFTVATFTDNPYIT
ncbi:MAG: hypothetical protein Q8O94_02660 [bacterium]|nr:hypothetical protein [bacterium]